MKKKKLRDKASELGIRASDTITKFLATWKYVFFINFIIDGWMIINLFLKKPFDPYPFILLNLFLSWIAANTPSLIMMSTARQLREDRERADESFNIDKMTLKLAKLTHERMKSLETQIDLLDAIIQDLAEEKKKDE